MEILVTKRLTLRPPLEVDAEAITEAFQNPNITRNLTNVPNPYGLQDALSWVERSSDAAKAAHFCIYREKLLGVVSISASKDNIYQLGYWLGEDVWGKGYMTEAARAALPDPGAYLAGREAARARQLGELVQLGQREVGQRRERGGSG